MRRRHQIAGWLWLEPGEARATLDQVMAFRDASPDPMASGLPEAAVQWFWDEQLPALVNRPDVRQQATEHLQEVQQEADAITEQLNRQAPDLLARLQELQAEVKRLEEVLA